MLDDFYYDILCVLFFLSIICAISELKDDAKRFSTGFRSHFSSSLGVPALNASLTLLQEIRAENSTRAKNLTTSR